MKPTSGHGVGTGLTQDELGEVFVGRAANKIAI
jgi:hypothetical protein